MYVYKSSCLFDTIVELSGSAYCNHIKYQSSINDSCKSKMCLLGIMISYISTGNEQELFNNRLKFCLKYFDVENGIICYRYRIGDLINQIFKDCTKNTFYLRLQKKFDTEILNIKQLTDYIKDCISDEKDIEDYLYVDVNEFYENCKCYLEEIPVRMTVKKKTFILVGAVAFEYSKFNKNLIHYTALCRTIRNNWCLKDNLSKKMKYLKNYSISIAILMYVECV